MIVRDEAVNLKTNLALWTPIVSFFVFLIDSRTCDDSIEVIHNILEKTRLTQERVRYNLTEGYFFKNDRYSIISSEFNGFGNARTKSMQYAWSHFPQASHILLCDPDWVPKTDTMVLSDLDSLHDVFGFTSYDRTNLTTR